MTIIEQPPGVSPALDWSFPGRSEHQLPNGLTVLVYNCPGQFVVAASLLFDVPLTAEPRQVEGVAGLVGRCLTLGAGDRSAEQFADAVALCGADMDAAAAPDGFAVRLSVPVAQLGGGLRLLADTVSAPRFDQAEFEQQKRLRLQEIDQAASYPQHVAVEQLNAALFGAARAARPVGGAAETVERVGLPDVSAYVSRLLQPTSATLVIAGDFAGLDPTDAVVNAFGDWQREAGQAEEGQPPTVIAGPRIQLVDWPDAPQATIRLAGRGITRADVRWPAMFVANYAVGGNFSSRLNTVLREEKGFTYGASSSLDTGRHGGLFTMSTAVRSDAAAEAVNDITTILQESGGTITDVEVSTAVRAATDSAALGFERAEAVVGRVEMLLSERLPLDHVDANLARIRAVNAESANAAYRDAVDPTAFTVVVVGDAAALRGPLAALGYGTLEAITPSRR
ncbi:MAG: insulinase family protein [Propionibacteriales bacterium]|nr:insulinase family protein [Propionibacteriales bacterium]